jgi:dihydrolipoamide dehydrogenase
MTYDLIVIGTGPGGYVCAIRAAQLGMKVAVVEKRATHGGTCLNVGCIPSKALLHASELFEEAGHAFSGMGIEVPPPKLDLAKMLAFKDQGVKGNVDGVAFLLKKNKIDTFHGTGTIVGPGKVGVALATGERQQLEAKSIVIATGSDVAQLPGIAIDEEAVVSFSGALTLAKVPKRLLVIGAGVIGLELGSVWRRLGAKVTVVELLPTILAGFDADVIKEADRVFRRQGLVILAGTKVTGARRDGRRVLVDIERDGASETLNGDYALVAIGRRPSLHGIDAASLGLALGPRGEIIVDAQMRTNLPGVFAIGDVTGGKLLAHKAEEEGVVAAEVIAGHDARMHYHNLPSVVYTWPEIATCGLAEHDARTQGRAVRVGKFPFSANGRARTMAENAGFVKFVADERTDEILGCHIVGPNASELLAEVVTAMEFRATCEDVGVTVHSHPTLSEAVKEAALRALGRAVHL